MNRTKLSLSLAVFLAPTCMVYANTTDLGQLDLTISKDAGKYIATTPNSLKDDTALYETAKSISVLTPQQVEQKQASTVAELLENVAGVSSGVQGRRGWDDFIIRGQVASNQLYVDGMRVQMSSNNLRAWDIAGADSIEVVKGTTTTDYGMALPSGIVNITSKRPDNQSFAKGKITLGDFAQKEFSFDTNYAPNQSKKGAIRLNGRFAKRDDATDYVYFEDNYIAPSYTANLGDDTDLTLLASYQWREYLRQQGLPHNNTINTKGEKTTRNAHQKYPASTFFGIPQNSDKQNTLRIGYDFAHALNDQSKLKSIFAYTKTDTDGNPTLATGYNKFYENGEITRQVNTQDKNDTMYTMDNRLETYFSTGALSHDLTVGLDLLHEKSRYVITRANANEKFDADTPDYTYTGTGKVSTTRDWLTKTHYAGLYAKDTIRYDNWLAGLGLRHDWASTKQDDGLTAQTAKADDTALTGNVSLMYDYQGKVAPYISFGTSFLQNTDIGIDGKILAPEKGQNSEIGLKFQGFNKLLQGYIAYYDNQRKNIAETVYNDKGEAQNYSALVGKQHTRGIELESALVLNNQWNISGSYSYIPTAKISQSSNQDDIGKRLSQIPKHSASLSSQYYFSPDRQGFYLGGGVRYQGDRTAWRGNSFIDLPAYTLFDIKAGYEQKHWGVAVAIKNLTDKSYLVGTSPNSQLVSYGEPRNIRASLSFKY